MGEANREFDLVVQGATGFTGRLTAEYLLARYGTETFRWALAGRNEAKLEEVRAAIARDTGKSAEGLPLVVGDATDAASMTSLAERARVVCSTVGPYALYGSELVSACARAGTHYCDLTGEVFWMRGMIDAHQDEAAASGARIVHACGFDCIPADLGVFLVQREMNARHGVPASLVKMRVSGFKGGGSGGTAASGFNMLEEAASNPEVDRVTRDPYALNPKDRRQGPDGPDRFAPEYDDDFAQWTGPFIMAGVDTRIVRRTNALLDYAYGTDFRYDEAMLMGEGPVGFTKAAGLAAALRGGMAAMKLSPLRRAVATRLPAPGTGPSKAVREAGYWDIRLVGVHPDDPGKNLRARLTGDRDPGYGSTAKMLGESAVCLALDLLSSAPGFLTPAAAMGEPLLTRLRENAGVTATIEED
ncbi:MAG: saccharopine dehydrogenase NADP-binding domain-containing protein [Deltaproteobacteria bacterium]|nr:saccharopine dehydrogenase NADP-binding domain-containing protein [Deltaproteobacteria bacterium]MBW2415327.1 saccharopine dehydrogenase NADP-binding domain-containing protein [Deltaproteobacteria bacterium]